MAQCEDMLPKFGSAICSGSSSNKSCVITCEDGYALPISASERNIESDEETTSFVCENSDPVWTNPGGQLFPDCTGM